MSATIQPLLEVKGLRMHFPIIEGLVARKLVGEVRVADDDRPTRIALDEAAFCDLVAGKEVERADLRGHKVQLILSDIGWDRMVDAIAEAMMASELPLGQGRASSHGPRNGP